MSWQPEGFERRELTVGDIDCVLDQVSDRIREHFEDYGAGIFLHPHEIVGCMYGQVMKLSKAADESVYTGNLDAFMERCLKTLLAMIMATASVEKLDELRHGSN